MGKEKKYVLYHGIWFLGNYVLNSKDEQYKNWSIFHGKYG